MASISKSWEPELKELEQELLTQDQSDRSHANNVAAQAESNAKGYTDTKASQAETNAINHAKQYGLGASLSSSVLSHFYDTSTRTGFYSYGNESSIGYPSVIATSSSNTDWRIALFATQNRVKAHRQRGGSWWEMEFYTTENLTLPEDKAAGAVGSYAMLYRSGTSGHFPGSTSAGSNLEWATASGWREPQENPLGTWRLMGTIRITGSAEERTSLWLRIA